MDYVREQVALMMEHHPTLTKLEGKPWYDVEDSIVNLINEITGVNEDFEKFDDPSFNASDYLLHCHNSLIYRIYKNAQKHYWLSDLDDFITETYDEEKDKELITKIKSNSNAIINKFDDYLDYDWREAMRDAIYTVIGKV